MDQWTREIPILAQRGKITDANGYVLADNQTAYSVFVRPRAVEDKEVTSHTLADCLGLDYQTVYNKITGKTASEITIAKQVEKEKIELLSKNNVKGVYFAQDGVRVYPYDALLCQTLGFTSSDHSGISGIEKYYEEFLCGKNGELLNETDLVGIDLKGAVAAYKEGENGLNVQLTIDAEIQTLCEKTLYKVYEESHAKSASCILLNPSDFSILALATVPSYDLNNVPRDDAEKLNALSRNKIVSDIYEPGSTFKVVTAAATIEEYNRGNKNALSPTHVYPSAGTRKVDGTTIKCWTQHTNGKHSNQTLAEALNNSCNPCFVDMALALGKNTFYDYLSLFGFGKETAVDLQGEAIGMLLPELSVRDCDLARIGFGQTVAVTPIQLACAVASAVNGGNYFVPHLVKRLYSDDKSVNRSLNPTLKNKTVSEATSRQLASMLEGVVQNGSGKKAYIEGYKVGGKTGTAQKYENGHIAQGKYIASFVGFFPSNAPKYLALVVVDEPQGVYYGSAVAAPCAKEIFEGIINLKGIRPYE